MSYIFFFLRIAGKVCCTIEIKWFWLVEFSIAAFSAVHTTVSGWAATRRIFRGHARVVVKGQDRQCSLRAAHVSLCICYKRVNVIFKGMFLETCSKLYGVLWEQSEGLLDEQSLNNLIHILTCLYCTCSDFTSKVSKFYTSLIETKTAREKTNTTHLY